MRYTYKCGQCGKVFDRSFPLAQNPESVPCEECGMAAYRHIASAPPVQYKGTGWAGHGEHKPKSQDEADLPGGAADNFTGQVI
jgi:putative FmdB family regulatory protein